MIKTTKSKYGTQRWNHKGYVVEQVGISYFVWFDFVRLEWQQPMVSTLAAARALISFEIAAQEMTS